MLEADKFLKELYIRLDELNPAYKKGSIPVNQFIKDKFVEKYIDQYKLILPSDKSAKILDIGVGSGWFSSICYALEY